MFKRNETPADIYDGYHDRKFLLHFLLLAGTGKRLGRICRSSNSRCQDSPFGNLNFFDQQTTEMGTICFLSRSYQYEVLQSDMPYSKLQPVFNEYARLL